MTYRGCGHTIDRAVVDHCFSFLPCFVLAIDLSQFLGAAARSSYEERIWLQGLKTRSIRKYVDCRGLIKLYHNSRHRLNEYHAICQLIRLTWQRPLYLGTFPEEVMPLVDEADKAFIGTRYTITGLDPPENLEDQIQLSSSFSQHEHHKFALARQLRSFEIYMEKAGIAQANNAPDQEFQNLAFQSFFAFLYWSFLSKGRGFVDILNLERSVMQNAKSEPEPDLALIIVDLEGKLKSASVLAPELISPLNNLMATKNQIDEMVQSLSDGVVIVD